MHAPRGTSAAITTVLIALMTPGSVSTARGDANEGNVRLLAVQPDARCGGLAATLIGTEGPDRLRGTPEKDVIVGLGGRDQISGDGGNDVICGGGRSDVINPGRGDDIVYGQGGPDGFYPSPGADRIYGGGGDDFLTFGLGRDRLSGGPGNDAFFAPGGCLDLVSSCKIKGTATQVLRGGRGTDSVDYITFHGPINVDLRTGSVEGAGDDRLRGIENVRGTMRDDVLIGDAGPNELDGWAGNDLVRGLGGSDLLHLASLQVGERDRLYGGAGSDWVNIFTSTAGDQGPFRVNLERGIGTYVGWSFEERPRPLSELSSIENVVGVFQPGFCCIEGYADSLTVIGDEGSNTVIGSRSDDDISLRGGNDVARGGDGDDAIAGGGGDDRLFGGRGGVDTLDGGPGIDDCSGGETIVRCEG